MMEQTGCLQTASLRTLCSNCEDAFRIWDNLIAERDSSNAKLYKAVEVREGASSGCSICKLLTFASSPRWKPTYLDEFYFTVDKTHGTIHDTPYMMVNTDSIAGIDPVVIPWPKLRRWLSSCSQEDHGHIAQPSAQRYLDTWLIDVEDRCLKPMTQDSEYAALSYVWGGDQPVLLQRNTLALQQTGAFDNATACSQTIRDAMQVCHNVGIRYIWVDSLCITQDAPPEKLNENINNMESIYSNSTFTIVAADSEHANHGIHGVSLKRREPATYTDSQRDLTLGVGSILALLQDTKWGGRAWTFQEALCSCRMLVFTQYMCGLICPKTVQREDGWIEASNQSAPNLPLSPDFAFIKVNVGNDWNRTLYDDIVSIYTARSLTQEKDIIDAFSGTMARAKDWWGDFWYGLPRNAFLYALSWANHHAAHRIFVTLDDALRWNRHPIAPRIGFPSWSWVGWIHPIGSSLSFATGTTRKTVAMYRLTESGTLILVNDPTLPPGSAGLKAGARDLLQFPDEEEELGKVKDKLLGSKIPLEPLLILRTTIFHVVVPQYPETPETGGWAIYRIMPFEDMQICKPHVAKFQESLVQLNCEWRASQPDKLEFALLGVTNVSSVSLQQPFSLITIVLARENGLCSRAGLTEFSLENFWEVDSEEILADIARHSLPETIVLT